MFAVKLLFSVLLIYQFSQFTYGERLFSKLGKRYRYEYNVDLQVDPDGNDMKKIGYKIQFDVYPKSDREYVIDITEARPYHGDMNRMYFIDMSDSKMDNREHQMSMEDFRSPFMVKRVKSRNSNKFSDYKISFTNSKESLWSQNLKKALVSMMEIDYRPAEMTYEVKQETLHGTCDYHYILDRRPIKDMQGAFRTYLTRAKNPDQPCHKEKMHSYFFADKKARCFQRTDQHSKYDYHYTIDEHDADHIVIKEMEAREQIKLMYGFHHEISYPIVSHQKLRLMAEEMMDAQKSSDQMLKDLMFEKSKGDYMQTTLEGNYQPYYGHEQMDDKHFMEKFNELASKMRDLQSGKDIDFKKFLHYDNMMFKMMKMSYEDIKRLYDMNYNNMDETIKSQIFFTLLGMVPNYEGIRFSLDQAKELIEGSPSTQMREPYMMALIRMLHSSKFPMSTFTKENGEHFLNFCKNDFVKNDRNLNKACWLAFSRIINAQCTKSNPDCNMETAEQFQEQTFVAMNINFQDQGQLRRLHNEILMLAIKIVKNFNLQSGLPHLRAILLDRNIHHGIRKEAAWVYYFYDKFDKNTMKTMLNILNDRREDYDLRLGLFFALVPVNPRALIPTVVRIRDSFAMETYQDDQQMMHGVHDLLYYSSRQNKTMCNSKMNEGANMLYRLIGDEYKKHFEFKDLTETMEYNQNSNLYRKIIFMTYASTRSVLPEGIFFSYGDSFNIQEFFFGRHYIDRMMKMFAGDRERPKMDKMLDEFMNRLGMKKPENHKIDSFTMSYTANQYDVFFIYADENSPANFNDFMAFLGNPIKNIFFIDFGSYTESGFPYYLHAKQSRFVRPTMDMKKFELYMPFATHGAMSSSIYLPMTDLYLVKGRSYSKYMKDHMRFDMKKFNFGNRRNTKEGEDNYEMEMEADMTYMQNDYYEKVRRYHFVESFRTLPHYYFIDGPSEEFSPDKHMHRVDNKMMRGYSYEIRAPYDSDEDMDRFMGSMHMLWLPTDTLFNRKYMEPYMRHFYKTNTPQTFGMRFHKKDMEQNACEYYMSVENEGNKYFEMMLKLKYDDMERRKSMIWIFKNHRMEYNTMAKLDMMYPKIVKHESNMKNFLANLPNATFAMKLYLSKDMEGDVQSQDNMIAQMEGVFYKRSTPDRAYEYQKKHNHCMMKMEPYRCMNEYWMELYRYDSMEMEMKQMKEMNRGVEHYMYKAWKYIIGSNFI